MTDYTVTKLDLSEQNLQVLPDLSLYTNLQILCCFNNQLTSLDNLPPTLQELYCWDNQLTRIGGADFRGSDNDQWTLVEEGVQRLTKTESAFGTSLDNLPPNLQTLLCSHNQLTTLDNLPPNLQTLWCSNNQLTSLDNLPPNLQELCCQNNQLTSLNNLPSTLKRLLFNNNPIYTTCKELYGFELSIVKTIEQYNEIKRMEKECCPLLK